MVIYDIYLPSGTRPPPRKSCTSSVKNGLMYHTICSYRRHLWLKIKCSEPWSRDVSLFSYNKNSTRTKSVKNCRIPPPPLPVLIVYWKMTTFPHSTQPTFFFSNSGCNTWMPSGWSGGRWPCDTWRTRAVIRTSSIE